LRLVDSDAICVTNINRQVEAVYGAVGRLKTETLRDRLLAINPDCDILCTTAVFRREDARLFGIGPDSALSAPHVIVDAIDSLTHKVALIELALENNIKLFSCMGMAWKLDPTKIRVGDIWKTHTCPLARLVREKLKKDKFYRSFDVVWSPERLEPAEDMKAACNTGRCHCSALVEGFCSLPPENTGDVRIETKEWCSSRKMINGSAVAVTATAGMILGSLVINGILGGTANMAKYGKSVPGKSQRKTL
jgi:tRNA A37 threonylcarbamoyladenosine dehydratase